MSNSTRRCYHCNKRGPFPVLVLLRDHHGVPGTAMLHDSCAQLQAAGAEGVNDPRQARWYPGRSFEEFERSLHRSMVDLGARPADGPLPDLETAMRNSRPGDMLAAGDVIAVNRPLLFSGFTPDGTLIIGVHPRLAYTAAKFGKLIGQDLVAQIV